MRVSAFSIPKKKKENKPAVEASSPLMPATLCLVIITHKTEVISPGYFVVSYTIMGSGWPISVGSVQSKVR